MTKIPLVDQNAFYAHPFVFAFFPMQDQEQKNFLSFELRQEKMANWCE